MTRRKCIFNQNVNYLIHFQIVYSYLYKGVQLHSDFIWFLKINDKNIKSRTVAIEIKIGNDGSRLQVPTEMKYKKRYKIVVFTTI